MIMTTIVPEATLHNVSLSHQHKNIHVEKRKMTIVKNVRIRPSDYVRSAFKANGANIDAVKKKAETLFIKPTQEMIDGYKPEILAAVRKNDLQRVIFLHKSGVLTNNCCNKFGESLLHLACRRGYTSIVRYLLQEVKISLNIRDDYYRTPLHDACWTAEPQYELVDLLVRLAPHQLLMADIRGFTPFDYVREEHQGKWLRFLWERREILRPLVDREDEIIGASVLVNLRG